MSKASAYVVDFGQDRNIAASMTEACDYLQIAYRLTASNKLVLAGDAVEQLRRQPADANGGISDDDNGVPCVWMYGYSYPVKPAFGPVQ